MNFMCLICALYLLHCRLVLLGRVGLHLHPLPSGMRRIPTPTALTATPPLMLETHTALNHLCDKPVVGQRGEPCGGRRRQQPAVLPRALLSRVVGSHLAEVRGQAWSRVGLKGSEAAGASSCQHHLPSPRTHLHFCLSEHLPPSPNPCTCPRDSS